MTHPYHDTSANIFGSYKNYS